MRSRGKSKGKLLKLLALRQQSNLQAGSNLVCVCADCKKIRDDDGHWRKAGRSFKRSGVEFTHGFCPDCLIERYSEVEDFISMSQRR